MEQKDSVRGKFVGQKCERLSRAPGILSQNSPYMGIGSVCGYGKDSKGIEMVEKDGRGQNRSPIQHFNTKSLQKFLSAIFFQCYRQKKINLK